MLLRPTQCPMFKAQVKVLRTGQPSSLVVPVTRRMAAAHTRPVLRTTCPSAVQEQEEQPAQVLLPTTQKPATQTHLKAMMTSDVIYRTTKHEIKKKT